MVIGVVRLVLQLPNAASLKARRSVVRSFKDRVRAKLPVTVAEVGDVERYQVATIGVAVISAQAARCEEILARAVSMARTLPDAVLADVKSELVRFGEGGQSLLGRPHDTLWPEDELRSTDSEPPLPWGPEGTGGGGGEPK